MTYNRRWLSIVLILAVISISAFTITASQPALRPAAWSTDQFLIVNLTVKTPVIDESKKVFSTQVTAVVTTDDGRPINGKIEYFWSKLPYDATVSPSTLISKDEKAKDFTTCTINFTAPVIPLGQPQRIYMIKCEVTNILPPFGPNSVYFKAWDAENITVLPVPEFPTPVAVLFIVAMAAVVLTRKKIAKPIM